MKNWKPEGVHVASFPYAIDRLLSRWDWLWWIVARLAKHRMLWLIGGKEWK